MANFTKRKLFVWKTATDLELLRIVAATHPSTANQWDEQVVEMINSSIELDAKQVTRRGCQEHLQLLLTKYKSRNRQLLTASGIEEDVTEQDTLCQELLEWHLEEETLKKDKERERQAGKEADNARKDDDEAAGRKIRHSAMRATQVEGDSQDEENVSKPKKIKVSRKSIAETLNERMLLKMEVKKEELELRKRELALAEERLQLDRERQAHQLEHERKLQEDARKERDQMLQALVAITGKLKDN